MSKRGILIFPPPTNVGGENLGAGVYMWEFGGGMPDLPPPKPSKKMQNNGETAKTGGGEPRIIPKTMRFAVLLTFYPTNMKPAHIVAFAAIALSLWF
ncbi:MAG: hypothetical protein HAW59_04450, partial [Betaproteobacteria bacterium]|nr:hypothetical protein [Betaproteobacteria bacterium]